MIRLILRLLGIKDFEVCQSCETLKQQLEYERDEKKRLTDTLIQIVSPKVSISEPVIELAPIKQSGGPFSRRRAAYEARDREEAKILQEAKHLGKPDQLKEINELERELGINDSDDNNNDEVEQEKKEA